MFLVITVAYIGSDIESFLENVFSIVWCNEQQPVVLGFVSLSSEQGCVNLFKRKMKENGTYVVFWVHFKEKPVLKTFLFRHGICIRWSGKRNLIPPWLI